MDLEDTPASMMRTNYTSTIENVLYDFNVFVTNGVMWYVTSFSVRNHRVSAVGLQLPTPHGWILSRDRDIYHVAEGRSKVC